MGNLPGQDDGKTVAIVSYVTLFGWIFAFIIHSGNKTRLGAFHLRHTLGLMLLVILVYILGYILNLMFMGAIISAALNIGLVVLWIMGLISAINGVEKPLPIFGGMFQKWFAGFAL